MTVCIAAECGLGNSSRIILCTDTKISTDFGSAETQFKLSMLPFGMYMLSAGSHRDIPSLRSAIVEALRSRPLLYEDDVLVAARRGAIERKKEKIDQFVQSKFGITYNEFLGSGKVKLPEDTFRDTLLEISMIDLGASAILTGYVRGYTVLIEIESNCRCSIVDNFAVTGAGGYLATAALLNRNCDEVHSFEHALYNVYEAKRFSEKHNTVGVGTMIAFIESGRKMRLIQIGGLEYLQRQFLRLGLHPLPADLRIEPSFFQGDRGPEASVEPAP